MTVAVTPISQTAFRIVQFLYQAGGVLTGAELERVVKATNITPFVEELQSRGLITIINRPSPWSPLVKMEMGT